MWNKNKEKNKNAPIAKNQESKGFQRVYGNAKNAEKNLHQTHTI